MHKLPKGRMSLKKNLSTRLVLYKLMLGRKTAQNSAFWQFPGFAPLAAAFVLLALITVLPSYAYASDRVALGSALYPLKKAIEKIELKLADDEEKTEKYLKFASKRLTEAKALSAKENNRINEAKLISTIAAAVALNAEANLKISDSNVEFNQEQNKNISSLEKVAQAVGLEASDAAVDAIASAFENFKGNNQEKTKAKEKIQGYFPSAQDAASTAAAIPPAQALAEPLAEQAENGDMPEPAPIPAQNNNSNESKKQELNNAEAQIVLESIKQDIEVLRNDLKNSDYEEKDVEKLFYRLDSKIEKTAAIMENEETGAVQGLLQSAEALTNNAKHFIKKKENSGANADSNMNQQNTEQDNNGKSKGNGKK